MYRLMDFGSLWQKSLFHHSILFMSLKNRRIFKPIIIVITVLIGLQLPLLAQESYQFSMLPKFSPDENLNRITPLCEYIQKVTANKINPVVTNDFSDFEKQVRVGRISIGYENPLVYTKISKTHEVIAMALKGSDGDKFRGVIITRKDSPIISIDQLKEKKISVVSYTSAGGYLSQKLTLMYDGIDIEKTCELIEATNHKEENVVLSVFLGEVDAGFIRESALDAINKYVPPSQIRIIKRTEWLPNWALSVNRLLPENMKKTLRSVVTSVNSNHPAIKSLKISGFRLATDKEYDVVRKAAGLELP